MSSRPRTPSVGTFGPRGLRGLALVVLLIILASTATACRAPGPPRNGVRIAKNIAWIQLAQRGWASQAKCLVDLWNAESGWNVYAYNRSSGAYGIPQALPGKKMAAAGRDWLSNPATQIRWGLSYIKARFGGPCNAWRFQRRHHWYNKPAPVSTTPHNPATTPARPVSSARRVG